MKQRKSIEIAKGVDLIVTMSKGEVLDSYLQIGKKKHQFDDEGLKDLTDWLVAEIFPTAQVAVQAAPIPVAVPEVTPKSELVIVKSVPGVAGPVPVGSAEAKAQTRDTALDNRRAVAGNGANDPSMITGLPKITRADGMEIMNLSGSISKAKEAFAPANLNKPEIIRPGQ